MTRPRPALPRKPGRPLAADADHRTRILDTTLAQFVSEGIAAVTLRGIAKQSGVTPALVSYYFGSKEQLVTTVIEERVLPVFAEAVAMLGNAPPADLIAGFVAGVGAMVQRHPWLPGLWVREILMEGGTLRELIIERMAPQLPRMLAARFTELQRTGDLNPDLDPRLLVVSLMGLTLFAHAARPVWTRIFAADDVGTEQMQRHTLALLSRGLELKHEN
ncbi:TetR/AcrR family transcriptional regulator [Arenimonas oryziterrae]|uniref:HTH tetR-type domain-containing protein n=1 Tax=Arenimonas oryziterrae DSM 21050 = YC6267 TaxID=1121015 RepID=A0A091ASA6_9GAMM|nr:TetR/AcrR family transcriptional regulator [Arenimonas oryziterrae]KFN42256.1 hypothetical protein N789_14325 [Arenimonas oryziterrae DSM 21050 = YC6267]